MTIRITTSQNTSYIASVSGETYILDPLATIIGTSGQDGFYFGSDVAGMTFVVNGTVKTTATTHAAIVNNADGNTVVISATGKTEGDFGVENYSGSLDVTNHGFIQANNYGFLMHGNSSEVFNDGHVVSSAYGIGMDNFMQDDFDLGTHTFHNEGFVSGTTSAIQIASSGAIIELGKASEVFSAGIAIINFGTGTTDLDNQGLIRSTAGTAFRGSQDSTDTFSNSGRIVGSIELRGGEDRFTMTGGRVDGSVTGGLGDDMFIITKGKVTVHEAVGQGTDTLKTAITMALDASDEFEKVILTGSKNIGFTADESANVIRGNKANNTIDGAGGSDTLTGGKGRDIFVHHADASIDTITDFKQGEDRIKIVIDGLDQFTDLTIVKQGQDVLINMENGDQFIVEDAKVHDFDRHDFMFG